MHVKNSINFYFNGMCVKLILFTGSLTDSICTAYENKIVKSTNIDTRSHSSDGEKEIAFAPMTNLTSMLGGKQNNSICYCLTLKTIDRE